MDIHSPPWNLRNHLDHQGHDPPRQKLLKEVEDHSSLCYGFGSGCLLGHRVALDVWSGDQVPE